MAMCEELQLPAERHARDRAAVSGWLGKRHGKGLFKKWRSRYVVLSRNFLFTYVSPEDAKPRKVVCLDDCKIDIQKDKGHEFMLTVTSSAGRPTTLGFESSDEMNAWLNALRHSGYNSMSQRLRSTDDVLRSCADALKALESDTDDGSHATGGGAAHATADVDPLHLLQRAKYAREVTLRNKSELARLQEEVSVSRRQTDVLKRQLREDTDELKQRISGLEADLERMTMERDSANEMLAQTMSGISSDKSVLLDSMQDLRRERDNAVAAAAASRRARLATQAELERVQADAAEKETELHRRLAQTSSELMVASSAKNDADQRLEAERAAYVDAQAKLAAAAPLVSEALRSPRTPAHMRTQSELVGKALGGDGSGRSLLGARSVEGDDEEWMDAYKEAVSLERAGSYSEAESRYRTVYSVRREHSGPHSVAVASAARDVARTLAMQRRYNDAEKFYQEAVDLCSSLLGEGHSNTASSLTDLAAVLREQGKYADAEVQAQRAVTALRRAVGVDDVNTATALYNLGGLAKRQGKFMTAEKSYAEALTIFQRVLGEGQAETADTLYQLGCLYRKQMVHDKAGQFFAAAAEAYKKAFGLTDRRVEESMRRAHHMFTKLAKAVHEN